MKCVNLRITGVVQGVCFRDWTVQLARELDLEGWVRNRRDGSVEAIVLGHVEQVDALIAACHSGPPAARVAEVHVRESQLIESSGFHKLPTL